MNRVEESEENIRVIVNKKIKNKTLRIYPKMASKTMIFCSVFLVCALWVSRSSGSAIPMWEYLSRGEKMSHLYTMFAKQVNTYCKTNTPEHSQKPQCKRELLMHGLGNLNKMDEIQLDTMDPYQRGATDIMWDHMMDGHPMMEGKKEATTVAPIREAVGNFPKNPLFDDDVKPVPKAPVVQNKKPQMTHEDYAMGMDMDPMYEQIKMPKEQENLYPEPHNHLHQETKYSEKFVSPMGMQSSGYLSGPMMIMVRPDGTMVHAHMPKDDDLESMSLGREQLPTMDQLSRSFGTTKNYLEESEDVAQPRRVSPQPQQSRSFFYHTSYNPRGFRSNQH